jgi:hypothetical protein
MILDGLRGRNFRVESAVRLQRYLDAAAYPRNRVAFALRNLDLLVHQRRETQRGKMLAFKPNRARDRILNGVPLEHLAHPILDLRSKLFLL